MPGPLPLTVEHPIVIAHRGASAYAPEHTHAAWELALRMGADYIEQDLQMTRDGVLIVMHDETLNRTARGEGCTGRVIDRTLAQVRDCSAGAWFNEARADRADARFIEERIPTLDDVLARYAGRARFYIETKRPDAAPGMEEALVSLLRVHGLLAASVRAGLPDVILQSFSADSLRLLARLAPDTPRVQLIENRRRADFAVIATYAHGVGPTRRAVTERFMEGARTHGLAVHPWTVNEPAEMRRLSALGVHGMFTDQPDTLREVLQA